MLKFPDNSDFNGRPVRNVPDNDYGVGPSGEYEPFGQQDGITNLDGNGLIYVPPVKPNPTFVPPSFTQAGKIKITLFSQEDCQFTENDVLIGFGKSISVEKLNRSFGSQKTYRAVKAGVVSKNYFIVSIQKKFNTIRDLESNQDILAPGLKPIDSNTVLPTILSSKVLDTSQKTPIGDDIFTFGYNMGNPIGYNDYLYAENVSVKEFEYNEKTNEYVFLKEMPLNTDSGVVNLEFAFTPQTVKESDKIIDYTIEFTSNFASDLQNNISLYYEIVDNFGLKLDTDTITFDDEETDGKTIPESSLSKATVNFKILGNLPAGYKYKNVYYKNRKAPSLITNDITKGWKEVNSEFSIPAIEIKNGIVVNAILERENIVAVKPQLNLSTSQYDKEVKDSDTDATLNILYDNSNADFIDVYLSDKDVFRINASQGYIPLSFVKDFKRVYGKKKIVLVPFSEQYGSGDRYEVIINFVAVNDFPIITQILFPTQVEIPSFSDGNIEWDVTYNTKAVSSVDVDLYFKDKSRVNLFKNIPPTGTFKINLRDLATKFPQWNGSSNLTLIFKPYNRNGETELIGNEYEISTNIVYPTIKLDEDIIRKSIYDAFIGVLKFDEPEKESKYLSHLINLGNDERILISAWEEDNWTLSEKTEDEFGNTIVKNEVKSIILKLYEPLPAEVSLNSTMWITKLMTNPLIETIVLNEEAVTEYPYIKGPNFDIEVDFVKGQSTNYESLDDLIISASSSSTLIQNYLSASLVDTSQLNIKYASGSVSGGTAEYLWENFVHFSSAAERVNNFVYKVQLIENYETLIASASIGAQTASFAGQQEVQRLNSKKSSLIQGFDGFETFLYTSSSFTTNGSGSITWPYNGATRIASSNQNVVKWYENLVELATTYDTGNSNWLVNNIPQYIRTNTENENYLLFFSMIGHHFDNIYYYTKAIERSRGLGYESDNGVANKILYEMLKSFSWDAKNLGGDKELWNYVFGEDKAGGSKQSTPSNERSKEVWRRIINNLPYLLKHKGTRRGIYALMACYGIPSSNLSIMEFGGPEVTDDTKNKLLMDATSYALKMDNGTGIEVQSSGIKSVELFIKPAYAQNRVVFVDNSINQLRISGSIGSKYGKVIWGNGQLSSSLLPIFNDRYFGICVSDWGSYRQLDVMQVDGDREIFYQSITSSAENFSGSGQLIIGNVVPPDCFTGSLDEVRLWNQPLSSSIFKQHVYYPEMINGNHISASTTDLELRFDFEYPKNLTSNTFILNVAPGIKLNSTSSRNYYEDNAVSTGLTRLRTSMPFSGSAVGFPSATTHPYQFEVLNRNVVLEMPDIGTSRYATNKVRVEDQTLLTDLSSKSRSTKKSFDNQPIDSNRVGLFFSPNKELNLDIAKTFGNSDFNDYIGDPSDRFKTGYKALDNIRNYYFERIQNRDIYAYINLIRAYEKAMFEDIKKMLPARVTATTGILIEPHFLERSKYQYSKPTGSNFYYEGEHEYDTSILGENNQYETNIDADLSENLFGENNQYDTVITVTEDVYAENNQYDSIINANETINSAGEYYSYETTIQSELNAATVTRQDLNEDTNKLVGKNDYVDIGFGIYAENGAAIRTYYDANGSLKKERIRVTLVEEQKTKVYQKYNIVINGVGDPRGGFSDTSSVYLEKNLIIQPYSGSVTPMSGSGSIVNATPLSGYLPTHYRYTSDLTTGLENSYFRGCKNTSATTLDGSSPIEVFVTNPNVIKVAGRDNNEPILDVE
ncbi:hypothetical protein UFOVP449_72 [uncultured Caudovirales phage]|uniref:Uncharacterized protein n=1 Tax=uncultured Caudovirales phage TaxID=2100421 RepID=A0A6J5M9D2_9CAUD|nr:hypothetical protein UFOVP449_72 [uncultured Caudovirales phage]